MLGLGLAGLLGARVNHLDDGLAPRQAQVQRVARRRARLFEF